MREGEIGSKVYQKYYKPIRLKKEEVELNIFRIKHSYKRRYFDCCELKPYYRAVLTQRKVSCNDDPYMICGLTKLLAKSENSEKNKKQT